MQQLANLEKENLAAKNQTKLFYTKLDEIYRTYLDAQLGIGSRQLTSDELMIRLKINLAKEETRTKFYQTLRLVDAVKFAKYLPGNDQNNEAIAISKETIKYIEDSMSKIKKENAY